MDYWKQKASPWVSAALLAGGLLSALILFWLSKIESSISITSF